ncbi:DUF2182 domain-containing protein [Nitratireductor sp. CAU 1489]|uniref:DUF2182 domain-containing protein n=1 Tax=Nitratireductor arenosus TaxID=2682096 RepID=A0A844QFG6_9HYPH|nr:DUF2182 domain-containing protein [Nitratireductor arenosus]
MAGPRLRSIGPNAPGSFLLVDCNDDFSNLDGAGRAVAALARQPRAPVYAALLLLILVSWAVLGVMAIELARVSAPDAAGPGAAVLGWLPQVDWPAGLAWFVQLCAQPVEAGAGRAGRFSALAAMWFLMSLAMMLPSAAPMMRTYCEIADTARAGAKAVVHPAVLLAGYLAVWLAAAVGFAGLTVIVSFSSPQAGLAPMRGVAGATALAIAGLYQFSGLKDACLTRCRDPFATLFARWSDQPTAIFRLGLAQGVWCLGCCWALMLVMFAVGIMNPFWMALLAVFALVEKQATGRKFQRVSGAILLVWSGALLVVSLKGGG